MLTFAPLADHQELIPLVARWLADEWPGWYGEDGPGNAAADAAAFGASSSRLPVGLIAFEHGVPIGICALKATSVSSHAHLSPWAAAGLVLPPYRGRGIGRQMIEALVRHARGLGYARLYCATATAVRLLQRAGWTACEVVLHDGEPLTIFVIDTDH